MRRRSSVTCSRLIRRLDGTEERCVHPGIAFEYQGSRNIALSPPLASGKTVRVVLCQCCATRIEKGREKRLRRLG